MTSKDREIELQLKRANIPALLCKKDIRMSDHPLAAAYLDLDKSGSIDRAKGVFVVGGGIEALDAFHLVARHQVVLKQRYLVVVSLWTLAQFVEGDPTNQLSATVAERLREADSIFISGFFRKEYSKDCPLKPSTLWAIEDFIMRGISQGTKFSFQADAPASEMGWWSADLRATIERSTVSVSTDPSQSGKTLRGGNV